MKRLFIIFITAIIFCFNNFYILTGNLYLVHAQNEYARILCESTVFYANPDCTIEKFILPYGYFVKILQIGVDSTKVCYMNGNSNLPESVGYIKTCDLFLSDVTPNNPYPSFILTLKSDEILFADSQKNYPKTVLSEGDTAYYYGELVIDGNNFCYVYSSGFIGYVRKSGFVAFTLPEHELPIPKPEIEVPEDSVILDSSTIEALDGQTATVTADETLKTVIIVAVCIVCLSIVYLIFKPSSQAFKPAISRDDDDDF